MNAFLIADIELTLRQNKAMQSPGESEWGFGQTLAIFVAVLPAFGDLSGVISKRPGKEHERANSHLKVLIRDGTLDEVEKLIHAGANPNIRTHGQCYYFCELVLPLKVWRDIANRTALEVAALSKNWDTVLRLVSNLGAGPNVPFSGTV